MVQSLMESFDTQQALFSQFLIFNPDTLEVNCEFGDVDNQLESMETDLGIDQGWLADTEESHGCCVAVEGYQQTLEKTLQDCIEDANNAACSSPSCWSNLLQSTGNSTITLEQLRALPILMRNVLFVVLS